MHDRLYRSPGDRVIAGVAGGLATWLNIDPSLIRIAWVLLAIFSGGIFLIVYFVMMIVVPLPPDGWVPTPPSRSYPGGGAMPGWGQPWDQGAGSVPGPVPGSVPGSEPGGGWPQGAGQPGASQQGAGQPGAWPQGAGAAPGGYPGQVPPTGAWPVGQPAPGWTQGPAWSPQQRGNAGIVGGVVLILLGIWFLVDQYVHINWDLVWPVIVMVAGGLLIAGAVRRRNG